LTFKEVGELLGVAKQRAHQLARTREQAMPCWTK
jgi:hypothetical protein